MCEAFQDVWAKSQSGENCTSSHLQLCDKEVPLNRTERQTSFTVVNHIMENVTEFAEALVQAVPHAQNQSVFGLLDNKEEVCFRNLQHILNLLVSW